MSHYITNKHAINGLTKAIAFEYGTQGITCNAICPGAIETDMMKDAGPQVAEQAGITYEQFLDNYAQESAIKRLNTVEEVAAMAVLLASDVGGGHHRRPAQRRRRHCSMVSRRCAPGPVDHRLGAQRPAAVLHPRERG